MTQLNEVESHYPTVMNSIAGRLLATDCLLSLIFQDPNSDSNWLRLDSVALQIRKVCELFLLGSTLAHLQDGTQLDPRHWRPRDAFAEIEKFNQHPLPLPLEKELKLLEDGTRQLVPASKPMPMKVLSAVYGQCGNLLHVPSADKVLDEKVHPFDWMQFREWTDGFLQLAKGHLLLLPSIKNVLVCTWSGRVGEQPSLAILGGEGEAILDATGLPDFSLILP